MCWITARAGGRRTGDERARRKRLLVAALYARKWLRHEPGLLPWALLERLDALSAT